MIDRDEANGNKRGMKGGTGHEVSFGLGPK